MFCFYFIFCSLLHTLCLLDIFILNFSFILFSEATLFITNGAKHLNSYLNISLCHLATVVPSHCSSFQHLLPSLPFLPRSLGLFYSLFFSCSFFRVPLSCHIHSFLLFSLLTFFSSFHLAPLLLQLSVLYLHPCELNLADFITFPVCECLLASFPSCYSEARCLFLYDPCSPILASLSFPLFMPPLLSSLPPPSPRSLPFTCLSCCTCRSGP